MVLDIVIIAIILISVIVHARKGLVITLVNMVGWIASFILAYFFCGKIRTFLCEHTKLDDYVHEFIGNRFSGHVGDTAFFNSLPEFLQKRIGNATDLMSSTVSDFVTKLIMTLIAFLILLLIIRIVCLLLVLLFSKKHHKGLIGVADGVLGAVFGIVIGLILVFVVFTILFLIMNLLPDNAYEFIQHSLSTSKLSNFVYEHNFILTFINKFIG